MSNRHARFLRRALRRDEHRRRTARIPPAEWAAMTRDQKKNAVRKARNTLSPISARQRRTP